MGDRSRSDGGQRHAWYGPVQHRGLGPVGHYADGGLRGWPVVHYGPKLVRWYGYGGWS